MSNTFVPEGYTSAEASNYNAYAGYASDAAANAGIDSDWFIQLIQNESAFNPSAQNPYSSASGIAQFINSTAATFSIDGSAFNPLDPTQALDAAATYVAGLVQKFIGQGYSTDQAYALAAKAYGDTASNNPNAATFQSRLEDALNSALDAPTGVAVPSLSATDQLGNALSLSGQEAVGSITGFGTNLSNILSASPDQLSAAVSKSLAEYSPSALATDASNIGSTTAQAASDQVGSAVTAAGTAISGGLNSIGSAITGATKPITSLFTNNTLERSVFIVLGVLLLAAALFTLVKSYGPPPAALAAVAA